MKKLLGIIGAATLTFGLIAPAQAMGSGDAYENMQVGVTYTVYEPSFTAGLKAQHELRLGSRPANRWRLGFRPQPGWQLGSRNR